MSVVESSTDKTPDAAAPRGARRAAPTGTRVYWIAFAVLMVLTSAWSLASPMATGPDENAHIVKAAAVVRGDLRGTSRPDNPGSGEVTVPASYASTMTYPVCLAFHGEIPATCLPPQPTGDAAAASQTAGTWVIRNNPAYYAVVGLPSLLPAGPYTLYLMRLVSAALCSAVLAWGFRSLTEINQRPMVVVGILTALTPMLVYLNSTVNPSALEISASLTLWLSLLALIRSPDPTRIRSRAAGIAVVSVLLANSRGLSPLYIAVIAVTVAVVIGPWSAFLVALKDRRTWPWLGVIVAGTLVSLAWTRSAGTLEAGGSDHPELGFFSTAGRTFFDTGDFLIAAIGRFGWADTALPMLAYLVYAALIGFPIVLALMTGTRRTQVAILGVVGVAVFLPVVVHAWQARHVGYIWTARYSMPLFVGVSASAGYLCRDTVRLLPRWIGHRVAATTAGLAVIGMSVAFLTNLHRYAVGDKGSWRQVFSGSWVPIPTVLLFLVELTALVVGAVLVVRLSREQDATSTPDAATVPVLAEPDGDNGQPVQ